jgi:hypothetical protein
MIFDILCNVDLISMHSAFTQHIDPEWTRTRTQLVRNIMGGPVKIGQVGGASAMYRAPVSASAPCWLLQYQYATWIWFSMNMNMNMQLELAIFIGIWRQQQFAAKISHAGPWSLAHKHTDTPPL